MLNDVDTLYHYVDSAVDSTYSTTCLSDTWGRLESVDQLSLISWLWLMGYVDRDLNESEEQLINSLIKK